MHYMANKQQKCIVRINPHPDFVKQLNIDLIKNGALQIKGLGVFKLQRMAAVKKGFNPGSGQYQSFPAYTKISFSPTASLKKKIQVWKSKI